MYAPRAHLKKGAQRPHYYYYYCLLLGLMFDDRFVYVSIVCYDVGY